MMAYWWGQLAHEKEESESTVYLLHAASRWWKELTRWWDPHIENPLIKMSALKFFV